MKTNKAKIPRLFDTEEGIEQTATKAEEVSKEEKPPLETTTLWDYPRQSYGKTPKGNNKFQGVTPAFIIWNLVQRYTKPGDLVVDPMAGVSPRRKPRNGHRWLPMLPVVVVDSSQGLVAKRWVATTPAPVVAARNTKNAADDKKEAHYDGGSSGCYYL